MLHSGIEAELLAGQVYQNNDVAPTRTANLWFARRMLFVEAGGSLLADSGQWRTLIKKLQPRASVVSRGEQAARAAVVFFDCENFTRQGALEAATASARNLRARLGEISQALGINLPVYVLFTRMDRLPFCLEFIRNLNNEEASQVLGVTLPMVTGRARRRLRRTGDRPAVGEFRAAVPLAGRFAPRIPGARNRPVQAPAGLRIPARIPQAAAGRRTVPGGPVPSQPVEHRAVPARILFHRACAR